MDASATRHRLLQVAIELFGRDGKEAVGTRAIAQAAEAQMSAITHYFGGKEELYLACAEHIAGEMRGRIAPILSATNELATGRTARARASAAAIEKLLGGFVALMTQEEFASIARFVIREQMNPSAAFTVIYRGAMQPVIHRLGELLNRVAADRLGAEEAQVRSLALLGQVFAFRFARASLLQTTGWRSVDLRETEVIEKVVLAHARAILRDLRRSPR